MSNSNISASGLRYSDKDGGKSNGSAFGPLGSALTMSCFLCFKHVARSQGSTTRLAGSLQFACLVCKPKKPEQAQPQEQALAV